MWVPSCYHPPLLPCLEMWTLPPCWIVALQTSSLAGVSWHKHQDDLVAPSTTILFHPLCCILSRSPSSSPCCEQPTTMCSRSLQIGHMRVGQKGHPNSANSWRASSDLIVRSSSLTEVRSGAMLLLFELLETN
jgi:hypothetical protein